MNDRKRDIYFKGSIINGYDQTGKLVFSRECFEGSEDFFALMQEAWAIKGVIMVKVSWFKNPIE
jgi:hypothetical protein